MNKQEVIQTIQSAGVAFSRIRSTLNTKDFNEGYEAAVWDMARMFESSTMPPTWEAERERMQKHIAELEVKVESQEKELEENQASIRKLLGHVNIAEVLGVVDKKKGQQRITVTFRK